MSKINLEQIDKTYLIDNILLHDSKIPIEKSIKDSLTLVKREQNDKPIIFVGAGTCGLGAGAGKTIKAAKAAFIQVQ